MTNELTGIVEIPVLALRDVVVYPQMVIPLFVVAKNLYVA